MSLKPPLLFPKLKYLNRSNLSRASGGDRGVGDRQPAQHRRAPGRSALPAAACRSSALPAILPGGAESPDPAALSKLPVSGIVRTDKEKVTLQVSSIGVREC